MDNSSPVYNTTTESDYGQDDTGNAAHVADESECFIPITSGKTSRRKRLSRACDRCRIRKVKCDLRRPTCANCEIRFLECEFFLPSQKRGRKKRGEGSLVEGAHSLNRLPPRPPSAASSPVSFAAYFEAGNVRTPQHVVDDIVPIPVHQYSPPISQPSTYGTLPASTESGLSRSSQTEAIIRNLCNAINEVDSSQSLISLLTGCADAFFDNLYPLMPIIHKSNIDFAISQTNSEPMQMEVSLLAILTSLCAVAIAILPKNVLPVKAEFAICFYAASRAALNTYLAEDLENPTSKSIAIRYLHAEYHHTTGKLRSSWHSLGDAIRICQGMRLHDKSSYGHMSMVESEFCRRVFFLLFVGDKSASILSNHPVVMGKFTPNGGITVPYPHSLGEVDSVKCPELDPVDDDLDMLTGFNLNYDLWSSTYSLLLEIESLRQRFLARPGLETSQQCATLADVSQLTELYLAFQTSLDVLPSGLQAHPTFFISTSSFGFQENVDKNRGLKALAIQRANLQISFQCLRMVVLHAMPALADSMSQLWSKSNRDLGLSMKIDPTVFESAKEIRLRTGESPALLLQKINVVESMLHVVCSCELDDLRINGESCVAKIRLVGAVILELIDNNPSSPLVATARKFRDSYPRILAHLDSRTSDSLYQSKVATSQAG